MTNEPVVMLRQRQGKRSQRELAREMGISAAYLTDLYKGRRAPGDKVLSYLGLEKVVTYTTSYRRRK